MSTFWIVAFVVLWAVVVLLAGLVLGLLRRMAALLPEVEARLRSQARSRDVSHGLAIGSPAPAFEAMAADGSSLSHVDFTGAPRLVLFVDRHCRACESLIDALRNESWSDAVPLIVVADDHDLASSLAVGNGVIATYQDNAAVSAAFQTSITPQAFAINEQDRIVARDVAGSLDVLIKFAEHARKEGGKPGIRRADTTEPVDDVA